ncbi:FAD-dependent monooxygenase [Amycolatopsis sp. NPDC101161]|uniref:FAD-dependent monooxygenase n=1 Tax=Amycolatopsis sp. NPDC101161 TaxID=3363940 RepID=UPI0038264EA0
MPGGKCWLPHGFHNHADGQLVYAAAGGFATTTALGTWVAPGFDHSHRCYDRTDFRLVVIPPESCGELVAHPGVFAVSPLLREARLALTDLRESRPGAHRRLRAVVADELAGPPEQSLRLPEPRTGRTVGPGRIADKRLVPLRNVVHSPMHHGKLFLLGDAAHIVPTMSAKGIHLALFDAEALARGFLLSHVWNYQASASWITDVMHDTGDASHAGEFRKRIARAEVERRFTSPAASRLFDEFTAGVN